MPLPKRVDKREALQLLRKARDEKGKDYIDPNSEDDWGMCEYTTPDALAGCIVGHVFTYAGVPLGGLRYVQGDAAAVVRQACVSSYVNFTPGAIKALAKAQQMQDTGSPWGEAVWHAQWDS